MSLFYKLAYAVGFTPWEAAATHQPAAEQVAALFDREQSERTTPYGRALDLGCGTGHWTIDLALRGWQVTGIELVSSAVRKARARAKDACVDVQFIQGDVTALRTAGIEVRLSVHLGFRNRARSHSLATASGRSRGDCGGRAGCHDALVGMGSRTTRPTAAWR